MFDSSLNDEYLALYKKLILINKILFILIIVVSLTVIISPYASEISYRYDRIINPSKTKEKESELESILQSEIDKGDYLINNQADTNVEGNNDDNNKIYIPSIDLESDVLELASVDELHSGTWRRPLTSTPDKGGNTVIIAHRYTSRGGVSGPNTFYHLPKVKTGDNVYVKYGGVLYKYEVYDTKIVDADADYIEDATTTTNMLTLYTCTPLWTASERFVVLARLISPALAEPQESNLDQDTSPYSTSSTSIINNKN